MPEYLAPGVYVEEVDTGTKPIEGVSTSTAGMVGVTERGPTDVPVLVTSVGEFSRWFGGQLRIGDYGEHRFFPHAIEGFFGNGGKRVYVVRTLPAEAQKAFSPLFDRGDSGSVVTTLLRSASEGTGTGVALPGLLLLPSSGLANNDWVRIGDGSRAEYRQAAGAPGAEDTMVPLHLPLGRSHANTEQAFQFTRATVGGALTLAEDAPAGASTLSVTGPTADVNAAQGACLEIGGVNVGEYRFVLETTQITNLGGGASSAVLHLDSPLVLPYAATAVLSRINLTAPTATANIVQAVAGEDLFYIDTKGGNFIVRGRLVRLGNADGQEVRRIGVLTEFDIFPEAYDDYPAGTLVQAVALGTDRATVAGSTTTVIHLGAGQTAGLAAGERVVIDPAGTPATVTIQSVDATANTITVTPALAGAPGAGIAVVPLAKTTSAAVSAGSKVLPLHDRMGVAEGGLLRVGSGGSAEVVTVVSVPTLSFVAPDPGNVVIYPELSGDFPNGTPVEVLQPAAPVAGRQATAVALPAPTGSEELQVSDGNAFANGELIRLTSPGGDVTYHRLTQAPSVTVPEVLLLQTALSRAHPAGSTVVQRDPLFDVEALDAGIWGNRLRISIEDETPGLVNNTTIATVVNPTTMRLKSASGVQAGTILEFFDPATGVQVGDAVKVSAVNRQANFTMTIQGGGLAPAQQVPGLIVRSREFRMTVRLLRQPDPTTPSRDNQVLDSEVYRYLSMDSRHSNYVEKAIGDIDGDLRPWDHRPEGASLYVRARDGAANQAEEESIRLGPEALFDILPDGREVPARLALEQVRGDDLISSLTDSNYIGSDNADPDKRTGLQSLRNVEEISIVGIPSRTSAQAQQAVIDHCEDLRYRFAVLDSRNEPQDTLTDVQDQRQQFDTKYAALYYPWLAIPDPFPSNLANIQEYAIPPSGHVVGIYARTDIERGVHKAPANEVVRGIVNLRRRINKEQQDILNPYPVNINVIRDFRDHNRGIRVYGARVITSDSDWKYVNVRRLLIFIEASIERGLQWVVFEPNAEPLWARVRRSVTNFLTVVWRNGALEGTKVEEAFYVKCDRTTMTQTDIDSGRLIVQIGVAPVKPAEFVIVRIGLWTARSDS